MEAMIALLVGPMVGGAIWLMLSAQLLRFLLGLALLSNAVNLAIFALGGLSYAEPPLTAPGAMAPPEGAGAALPQALILTAIVIGFGLFAFALGLALRAAALFGDDDADAMRDAEPREEPRG